MPTGLPSVSTFAVSLDELGIDPDRNRTAAVAFWLKRDIIRGVFAPTERLAVDFLADFYGIGLSPMREALLSLSSSALVIHEHQRGRFVAPVSLRDWEDVVDIYQRTFRITLTLAVERGGQAWEERVLVALYRSLRAEGPAPPSDPERLEVWHRARRLLHEAMRSGAHSEIACTLLSGLSDRLERYIYLFGDRSLEAHRDHHGQHRVIVDALMARDPQLLEKVMDQYFDYGEPVRSSVTKRLKELESSSPEQRESRPKETTNL